MKSNIFKIITWNVNYDERAKGDYEKYDWKHRKEKVGKFIRSNIGSIFHLQEVMPEYMKDIADWLFETHFLFAVKVHPCGRKNVSAFPRDMYGIKHINIPAPSDEHRQVFLKVRAGGFIFINAHFPINQKFREDFTDQLCELTENEITPVIVTGDFNSFPDGNGFDQTYFIQNHGKLHAATSVMIDAKTRKRALKTFEPFPYDEIPESAKNAPEFNLDHIFVKRLTHGVPEVHTLDGASDHYAISMEFYTD